MTLKKLGNFFLISAVIVFLFGEFGTSLTYLLIL
jgi:hypothetical protein